MEVITINNRRLNTRNLVIPEPKQLWELSALEKRAMIKMAKQSWAEYRSEFGFEIPNNVNDLEFGSPPRNNQKYRKSEELIYGLSLAQSTLSGINVCPWSSSECRACCVGHNGNNGFAKVMQAKIAKTRFLFEFPREAGIILADFWEKANSKVALGYEVGGRLNTYSDINWCESAPWIFKRFKDIQFYDYTKSWIRSSRFENYHLTYSASERTTDEKIIEFLEQGKNVAIVFSDWRFLPDEYLGYPVLDGDKDDVRWKDPDGIVVGLRRKGKLRRTSPMVREC